MTPTLSRRTLLQGAAAISIALGAGIETFGAEPYSRTNPIIPEFVMGKPMPANVRQLVANLAALTVQVQEQMYSSDGNERGFDQKIFDQYFIQIAQLGLPVVLEDLRSSGAKTPAEIDAMYEEMKSAKTSEARQKSFNTLFYAEIPAMFARYGHYFHVDYAIVKGASIPELRLDPIAEFRVEEITLPVFGSPVRMRTYALRPNLFRDWSTWKPEKTEPSVSYSTLRPDIVFIRPSAQERELDSLISVLRETTRTFPSFGKGDYLTAEQLLDPWRRASANLFLKAVRTHTGKTLDELSDGELRQALRALSLHDGLAHESVHVADNLSSPQQTGTLADHLRKEVRGAVGSAIGRANVAYPLALSTLNAILYLPLVKQSSAGHGADNVYIVKRVLFRLWKQNNVQSTAEQFDELPAPTQTILLDQLILLDDASAWELYRQVWDELESPQSPLSRGLDQQPVYTPDTTLNPVASPETPFWQNPVVWVVGVLGVVGGLAAWRHARMKGLKEKNKQTRNKRAIFIGSSVNVQAAITSAWKWITSSSLIGSIAGAGLPLAYLLAYSDYRAGNRRAYVPVESVAHWARRQRTGLMGAGEVTEWFHGTAFYKLVIASHYIGAMAISFYLKGFVDALPLLIFIVPGVLIFSWVGRQWLLHTLVFERIKDLNSLIKLTPPDSIRFLGVKPEDLKIRAIGYRFNWMTRQYEYVLWFDEPRFLRLLGLILPWGVYIVKTNLWRNARQAFRDWRETLHAAVQSPIVGSAMLAAG